MITKDNLSPTKHGTNGFGSTDSTARLTTIPEDNPKQTSLPPTTTQKRPISPTSVTTPALSTPTTPPQVSPDQTIPHTSPADTNQGGSSPSSDHNVDMTPQGGSHQTDTSSTQEIATSTNQAPTNFIEDHDYLTHTQDPLPTDQYYQRLQPNEHPTIPPNDRVSFTEPQLKHVTSEYLQKCTGFRNITKVMPKVMDHIQ